MDVRNRTAGRADSAILERLRAVVTSVLREQRPVPGLAVYLFGSWASGAQRPASDIDLAVDAPGPLPPGLLVRLRGAVEESTLPYRVEIVDLRDTDAAFRERVKLEGILWIGFDSA